MKKNVIALAVLFGFALIFILYHFFGGGSGKGQTQSEKGKVYFKFTDLPEGTLARSGKFEVKASEVAQSPAMDSFKSKQKDIQFVLIYQQFVSRSKKPVKDLYLSFSKVSRSISSLLNQYGVPLKAGTNVHFSAKNLGEAVAKADSQKILEKDVDYNNFIWASLATEIFHFKLASIDKILKNKIIEAEAEKLKISKEKFKEENIYKKLIKKISESDIEKYMKNYSMEESDFNRRSARDQLLNNRKKRALDYILEKYLISFPVEVDVKRPDFKLEAKPEWTPMLGEGKKVEVTFFGDTRSEISENLLKELISLVKANPDIQFSYRPIFLDSNRLQMMITQVHLCVWEKYPEKFWSYFGMTLGGLNENTEKSLYGVLEHLELKVDPIKQCLIQQSMKKVVQYHIDYAHFLGIHLGPILYVGGEVLQGRILTEDVKKILDRQLKVPTAGVW